MIKKMLILSITSLYLTGCGGGNDSNNNNSPSEQLPPNKVESQLLITKDNQITSLQANVETQDQTKPLYRVMQSFEAPNLNEVGTYELSYNYYEFQFNAKNQLNENHSYIVGVLFDKQDLTKEPEITRLMDVTSITNPIEYICYSYRTGCKNITMSIDPNSGSSYATFNNTLLYNEDTSKKIEIKLNGKISGTLSKPPIKIQNIEKTDIKNNIVLYNTLNNSSTNFNGKHFKISFTNHNIIEFWSSSLSPFDNLYIKTIDNQATESHFNIYSNIVPSPKVKADSLKNIQFNPKTFTFNFNKVKLDGVLKDDYLDGQVGL